FDAFTSVHVIASRSSAHVSEKNGPTNAFASPPACTYTTGALGSAAIAWKSRAGGGVPAGVSSVHAPEARSSVKTSLVGVNVRPDVDVLPPKPTRRSPITPIAAFDRALGPAPVVTIGDHADEAKSNAHTSSKSVYAVAVPVRVRPPKRIARFLTA